MRPGVKKTVSFLWVFSAAWIFLRWLLPLGFPFLLGGGIALMAEPMVSFLSKNLRLPRSFAAGIGVTATVISICLLLLLACGFLIRELAGLSGILPDMEMTARAGIGLLQDWLLKIADRCPPGIRAVLRQNVEDILSGGSALIGKCTQYILGLAGSVITRVPDSALCIGTAILAGYMISAKLPAMRRWAWQHLPRQGLDAALDALKRIRATAGLWMISQLKLAGITFAILTAGFFLLRISYAPFAAFLVALVDAFPVLGTGSVLLPWSLICLLQQDGARALGILGLYITAAATRSFLEPKLVGHQLGMDPLVTLIALYSGYRLWGIGGMLLMPLLAASTFQLLPEQGSTS